MNCKKLYYVETDERGIDWEYVIILDKKLKTLVYIFISLYSRFSFWLNVLY